VYRDGLEIKHDKDFGIRVTRTRDGHIVETFKVHGVSKFFVTLKDSVYCAHGDTVADAVADALWKDPARRPSAEALAEEIKAAGKSRRITLREFRLLTGACATGCAIAMKRAGVTEKSMTVVDIRDRVSREWGNKLLRILGWA
jgi:hypothetical protein